MLSPPKKKKLKLEMSLGSNDDIRQVTTHKKGTQDMFVKRDVTLTSRELVSSTEMERAVTNQILFSKSIL